jgi:putative restriction endonuclease
VHSHARKPYEYRFQNPGRYKPIVVRDRRIPILLGYSEHWQRTLCVGADAGKRVNSNNRFSILFNDGLMTQAATLGWAEYQSEANETIVAFDPSLLGAYVDTRPYLSQLPSVQIAAAIQDTGFNDRNTAPARQRAMMAMNRLLRNCDFGGKVVAAYAGRCAMCGMDWDAVQGAHIYPVAAPASPDEVWNGLALCGNHHLLFDRHRIYVDPSSFRIRLDPSLQPDVQSARGFVNTTFPAIRLPGDNRDRPDPCMFAQRYEWFKNAYRWAS